MSICYIVALAVQCIMPMISKACMYKNASVTMRSMHTIWSLYNSCGHEPPELISVNEFAGGERRCLSQQKSIAADLSCQTIHFSTSSLLFTRGCSSSGKLQTSKRSFTDSILCFLWRLLWLPCFPSFFQLPIHSIYTCSTAKGLSSSNLQCTTENRPKI